MGLEGNTTMAVGARGRYWRIDNYSRYITAGLSSAQYRVTISLPFELIKTGDGNRDIEVNTRRLIEEVYAPHIQANWDSWVRSLWSKLEPVPESGKNSNR